jgi:hypothetical protein
MPRPPGLLSVPVYGYSDLPAAPRRLQLAEALGASIHCRAISSSDALRPRSAMTRHTRLSTPAPTQ